MPAAVFNMQHLEPTSVRLGRKRRGSGLSRHWFLSLTGHFLKFGELLPCLIYLG